jgi:hypothetical protein
MSGDALRRHEALRTALLDCTLAPDDFAGQPTVRSLPVRDFFDEQLLRFGEGGQTSAIESGAQRE